jgi:hypothetical protein
VVSGPHAAEEEGAVLPEQPCQRKGFRLDGYGNDGIGCERG